MSISPSLLIGIGAANGVFLALLLWFGASRYCGARWLALLLFAIALRMAPYILGFAGAYDRWRWLTFAPFDLTLAWGPLLWMYVHVLATAERPQHWRWHFAPTFVQFAYQVVCFSLNDSAKWEWYTTTHLRAVEPTGLLLALVSLACYVGASTVVYRHWQQWLDANISNRDDSRLAWLRTMLVALAIITALGVAFSLWHWLVAPLDYFARAPLVTALALLMYVIGLLGWRYGPNAIPIRTESESAVTVVSGYADQADQWLDRIRRDGWHRDPTLTLASLAQKLDTSPRTLSRVFNEGVNVTFNDAINRLRAIEASERLRLHRDHDVLRIAFDVGFASKASFNRAFQRHIGMTPSEARHVSIAKNVSVDVSTRANA